MDCRRIRQRSGFRHLCTKKISSYMNGALETAPKVGLLALKGGSPSQEVNDACCMAFKKLYSFYAWVLKDKIKFYKEGVPIWYSPSY